MRSQLGKHRVPKDVEGTVYWMNESPLDMKMDYLPQRYSFTREIHIVRAQQKEKYAENHWKAI